MLRNDSWEAGAYDGNFIPGQAGNDDDPRTVILSEVKRSRRI